MKQFHCWSVVLMLLCSSTAASQSSAPYNPDANKDSLINVYDLQDFPDAPFMVVEKMPALEPCLDFSGDERHQCTQMEIVKYVSNNTKYPPTAKDAGIQGTVFVYFVVGKDGKVRDAKVLRGVDSRLDDEAVRVVKSLPAFEPGQQRGKPVSVQYTIPVKFTFRPIRSEKRRL